MIDTGKQATNLFGKSKLVEKLVVVICERNRALLCKTRYNVLLRSIAALGETGETARHNNDNDYHQCNFYNNLVSRFPY